MVGVLLCDGLYVRFEKFQDGSEGLDFAYVAHAYRQSYSL